MSQKDAPNPTPSSEQPTTAPRTPSWATTPDTAKSPTLPEGNSPVAVSGTPQVSFAKAPISHDAGTDLTETSVTDTLTVRAEPQVVQDGEHTSGVTGTELGRSEAGVPEAQPAGGTTAVTRRGPDLSPQERLRRQNWMGLGGRMVGGLVTLGLLFLAIQSGWPWATVLFAWVLLTILADEFGGWFGYLGVLLGGLTLLAPAQPVETWSVALPLVGGALLALLVVKHSGGWGVLPFAAAVFALPIIGAAQYGHLLDENLIMVADPDLQRSAILAMLVGLALSLVRQFVLWIVDLTGRRAERRLLHADQATVR
ncbi:hypothetical protein [Deinococcus radiophilus]|uniref:Uncharacterized protein n=1 Tax=Deinococcus radiophilus TaxID=32062 RepID=A0A3S0RDB6_9DEIO|nr:hypothetical protein [Deinococcus radiophilus]RTR25537.1 hypothetical protein EJ104_10405 [Deinococcus radiophilus]UFA50516.1 hypothetical protein LMT64_00935 [Deinococcus radiophilus]